MSDDIRIRQAQRISALQAALVASNSCHVVGLGGDIVWTADTPYFTADNQRFVTRGPRLKPGM